MSVHSPDNKIRPWLILSGAVENRNAIVRPGYLERGVRSLTFELYASAFHCDRVLRMFEECEVLCGAGTGNCCNVKEKVYIFICVLITSVTTFYFLNYLVPFNKNQKFARVNSLWVGLQLKKSRRYPWQLAHNPLTGFSCNLWCLHLHSWTLHFTVKY